MSRAKTLRHGNKLQTIYQSSNRLNATRHYPIRSSNGSSIIIAATDAGLRFSWIGGQRLYSGSRGLSSQPSDAHSILQHDNVAADPESDDEALFESEDEGSEDANPPTTIIQDVVVSLPGRVLHLAVPSHEQMNANTPPIIARSIVVATSCDDGSSFVVILPLDPPSAASKRKGRLGAQIYHIANTTDIVNGIAMRYSHATGHVQGRTTNSQPAMVVAIASTHFAEELEFFSLPLKQQRSKIQISGKSHVAFHTTFLDAHPTSIVFNPAPSSSARQSQILVSDNAGTVAVYDLSPSDHETPALPRFVLRLNAPHVAEDLSSAQLGRRKSVLSATWAFSGTAIVSLLEDGAFGLYALDTPFPLNVRSTNPFTFAVEGFVGDAPENRTSKSDKRDGRPVLAPMTPNTRRKRSESLFAGMQDQATRAPRGKLVIYPDTTSGGQADSNLGIWYNDRLFIIPSLLQFWTRNAATGRDLTSAGNLYGSGISAMDELDLDNQVVVDVSILPTRGGGGPFGPGPRDIWISAEYRDIILARARHGTKPSNGDRQVDSSRSDQMLLDRGELDVNGMDRMLESMEGVESTGMLTGRDRTVGFSGH